MMVLAYSLLLGRNGGGPSIEDGSGHRTLAAWKSIAYVDHQCGQRLSPPTGWRDSISLNPFLIRGAPEGDGVAASPPGIAFGDVIGANIGLEATAGRILLATYPVVAVVVLAR
jgi:hypothetical protein